MTRGFPERRQEGVETAIGHRSKWYLVLKSHSTGLSSSFLVNFSFIKF